MGELNYIDHIAERINSLVDDEPLSDEWRPLFRIYAVLALAKGVDVTLKDVHDAWSAYTAEAYPEHPSLVPFDELKPEVQALDVPYMDAIYQVANQEGL
jgi:hypothetical protein